MQPRVVVAGPLVAGSATSIALAQSVPSAGNLVLNGPLATAGIATLDSSRQIILTSSGNDSGITFTITGTGYGGQPQTEILPGANAAAAASALGYVTVSKITASGAAAGTVSAGTNGVGFSQWVNLDPWAMGTVSGQCVPIGTANYSVQVSNDDPNSYANPVPPYLMAWDSASVAVSNVTAETVFNIPAAPLWIRVILNSGTGSVRMNIVQHNVVSK